jgi:hypothetical protein
MQLSAQSCNGLFVGALAHHRLHGITRSDIQQKKRDDEHAEERRNRQEQSAKDERRHRG